MTRWAESLIDLPPTGAVLVKATLLLALGWMLYAMLLRANPRWRVLLWRGILVALLALPVAEMVLPELHVAIRREAVNAEPEPLTAQPLEVSIPIAIPSGVLEGDLELPSRPPIQPQETHVPILTRAKEHLKVILFSCWALVSAVLLLRLAMTANRVRRVVQQAGLAPEQVLRAAKRVAKDMGCRAAVDVRVMPNLASPFLIGHWRPVVVVPARMTGDDQAKEWPAIFAHELAHHMSRDILWLPLTTIAATLLWFHPLAWRMCAAHRRACEEVSDGVASDYIGDDRAYSQTLARSALAMTDHMQAPGGLPMIRSANIARRLAKIHRGLMASALPRMRVRSSLAIGLILLGVLSSLRLVQAQKEELSSPNEQSDSNLSLAQRESEEIPQETTAGPELENPFSAITDESQLAALRDASIADGDIIRACDAEMQRVKARDASGNVWKDKIDLVKIYEEISERPESLSVDEVDEILNELDVYAAAHAADPDYAWRVWHLCSVFTRGHDERSIAYMEKSISAYPRVKYAIPSKHSKFQHLVNEMAMLLWDREGVEAAEDYVVEMWETDRRFVHFFDHPWQLRYESGVGGEERLERLHARMQEKSPPPLERITLILTPEGIRYRDEIADWATLEKALGEIANPYDHFLALGITTEDLPLRAWREAQARCIALVKKLKFDHFSDIGVQQDEELPSPEEQSDSDLSAAAREPEAVPLESTARQQLENPSYNGDPELLRLLLNARKKNLERISTWRGKATRDRSYAYESGKIINESFEEVEFAYDRTLDAVRWNVFVPYRQEHFGALLKDELLYRHTPGVWTVDLRLINTLVILPREGREIRPDVRNDFDPMWYFTRDGIDVDGFLSAYYGWVNDGTLEEEAGKSIARQGDIITWETGGSSLVNHWVFDLSKGGNLVLYHGKDPNVEVQYDWSYEQIDGVWIPLTFEYENRHKNRKGQAIRRSIKVVFSGNEINVPLADDEFTLERLGVKPGTRVTDHVNGFAYRYGEEDDRREIHYKTSSEVEASRPRTPTDALKDKIAPDFTVALLDGGSFTLSEHKGEIVILDFWATGCGPCRVAMPVLSGVAK